MTGPQLTDNAELAKAEAGAGAQGTMVEARSGRGSMTKDDEKSFQHDSVSDTSYDSHISEEDLKTLKRHWQTHEAVKQRNELRKVTQLQPLDTTLANFRPDQDDEDGSSIWMQREMERRKALLSGTKQPQRKVFSGSRHLRTLSLLSPDKAYSPSFPQPLDIRSENRNELRPDDTVPRPRPRAPTRHTTSPDIANEIANTVTLNGDNYDLGGLSNIQRDAILRTGKQMATDFKDGLLTFIEDIRQATVGEEAVNGVDPAGSASVRGPSAKGSRKPSDSRPTLSRAASAKAPLPAIRTAWRGQPAGAR